ncbi:hypothetical protein F5X98DRAFT_274619 [Xylaria grammica]|nr:hypothetical protein F5X98DRAFT_274619 [Xylaria grammica]
MRRFDLPFGCFTVLVIALVSFRSSNAARVSSELFGCRFGSTATRRAHTAHLGYPRQHSLATSGDVRSTCSGSYYYHVLYITTHISRTTAWYHVKKGMVLKPAVARRTAHPTSPAMWLNSPGCLCL